MAQGVLLVRPLKDSEVTCPAGDLVKDCDVHCKIEGHVIEGRTNPDTVGVFCTGPYHECSSWRAARKAEEMGRNLPEIIGSMREEGAKIRVARALRQARIRQSQRLLNDPGPEGQAYRMKVRRVMDAAMRAA